MERKQWIPYSFVCVLFLLPEKNHAIHAVPIQIIITDTTDTDNNNNNDINTQATQAVPCGVCFVSFRSVDLKLLEVENLKQLHSFVF
jgi:hypothetical protein